MSKFVMVRHGQSQWNLENKFTGEVDVPLTDAGRREAAEAGEKLEGIVFDQAFTSSLVRAQETLLIILDKIDEADLKTTKDKALNERNYGDLQGLNKKDTSNKYGAEQVEIWRRSFAIRPPGGESLEDTANRVMPYYQNNIEPLLKAGKNILLVAHGNSLRALLMHLEKLSAEEIAAVNIPTGVPRLYEMDEQARVISAAYL